MCSGIWRINLQVFKKKLYHRRISKYFYQKTKQAHSNGLILTLKLLKWIKRINLFKTFVNTVNFGNGIVLLNLSYCEVTLNHSFRLYPLFSVKFTKYWIMNSGIMNFRDGISQMQNFSVMDRYIVAYNYVSENF